MEPVGHFAAAFHHAEYCRSTGTRMRQALQHQRTAAFRHHEAVAVLAEMTRGSLWRIVASG